MHVRRVKDLRDCDLVACVLRDSFTAADEQRLGVLLGQFHQVSIFTSVIDEAIRIQKQVRIKTPDALIAATALVEGSELVTRNVSDFAQVPGLKLIDSTTL